MFNNLNLTLGKGQYAIIEKQNEETGESELTYFQGLIHELQTLDEVREFQNQTEREVVFMNPFRTVREKGYESRGDEPILLLEATSILHGTRDSITDYLQSAEIELDGEITPTQSDEDFAEEVASIQANEIAGGNASQVIYSRRFEGKLKDYKAETLHSIYTTMLQQRGQYMTMLFSDNNEHAFVGATPERHLEIRDGKVVMDPIAATLAKASPDSVDLDDRGLPEDFVDRLMAFLDDKKEINELYQVLDEELKMMAAICPEGGKIIGPFLRESGPVIHTEYVLVGENGIDPIDALRVSLHAPTLVGSPEESACRIIFERESESRRYYGGQIAHMKDSHHLDSAIMIRSAEIFEDGSFAAQAGAGIVEDSVPMSEANETTRKANGFLNFLTGNSINTDRYLDKLTDEERTEVDKKLEERNRYLAPFHMESQSDLEPEPQLKNKKVLILNNEDDFAVMIGHMARHMGCKVDIINNDENFEGDHQAFQNYDLVIGGPGPGDPRDMQDPRMLELKRFSKRILKAGVPFLGVCLTAQRLAMDFNMEVAHQEKSTQGQQRDEIVFGESVKVGTYNSLSAKPDLDLVIESEGEFQMSIDENDRVMAFRTPGVTALQFHPESVMSRHGYELLRNAMLYSIKTARNYKELREDFKKTLRVHGV